MKKIFSKSIAFSVFSALIFASSAVYAEANYSFNTTNNANYVKHRLYLIQEH